MRVRALDDDYDMTFGAGSSDFLVDSPDAVAQVVLTRLRLYVGDWFLDLSQGTPWAMRVLGKFTGDTRDVAIKARILGSQGVVSILTYASQFDTETRTFSVQVTLKTLYGVAEVTLDPTAYQRPEEDTFAPSQFTEQFLLHNEQRAPGFEVGFEQP